MNDLTKFLVDSILNEDTIPGKTALFGGGFKPPTRGHLDVVLQGLKDNPEVDEVYIFVGSGVRNNISQEESIKIWEMYKPLIPIKTTIIKAGAPLRDMKRFIEDTEDKPYIFIGARPDNEEDEKDVAERSKFFEKYGGIPKRVSTADSNVSGTRARNAAKANNKEELFSYFPDALSDAQKEEIYKMLLSVVAEQIDFKSLEQQLDNMFAELDIDIAFTTHFKERVLERGLTEDDILELAEKIIDAYPDQLDFLNQGQNIVMSHLSRLVDIAAVNTGYGDDYLKDLVFKTAFKRKDKSEPEFRTNASSPRLSVNEGIIDVNPKEEEILRKVAKEYIIPALKNRVHNKVLVTMKYKLSNGEDGKVGFYVYNKDDSSAAHFNSRDDKNRFDNLIGINAFENELAFAGGLERIYTRLTGDSPFRDLLDSLRHEFIHAKDPGANDDTFAAKHTGKTFADYYGGWIEFPAQTGEFLLAIKNNALDYVKEKGRLTTRDTEYLSNVFQDILDFYARNASMNEMSKLVIDFFTQGKSNGFQKFVKKIIDFGGDTLGIRTTPDWSQSDAFEKFYTKLRRIRNFNEEGYKEFQKDLYVLIQKLIEQINKDLPQGVKPIYAGGKNRLNENASYSKEINIREKIDQLTQHMIDKGMNIEPLPSLEFIDGDAENARDFFGKTAYYDPNTQTIVLYTEGRHPKDIVRSYAHEMIHHIQNLEGRLGNITTTNTQEDDALNDIEAEANLKGTMTFRNWTDSLNEVGDASQKPYNWNRTVSKDPDDGLIEGVDYRFTTDLDTNYVAFFQMVGPMEYEFGFNIPGGNQAQVSNKGELFRVMATMVAIMKDFMDLMGNDWSEISFSGSKDPSRREDNRRDKLYMAYIKKNLPSSVNVSVDDDDMTVLSNTLAESLNEIGDASAGVFPYNKNRIDTIVTTLKTKIDIQPDAKWQQHLLPFLKFSSPNADYDVITTAQVNKPLNIPDFQTDPPTIDLRVDFMVGESDEATNIGEQYKVMATMTQIIKDLIAKISKLEGPRLESVKIFPKSDDGSEEADVDSKRGKLYQAYVEKNLPQGWKASTGKNAWGSYIALHPTLEEGFNKKLGKDPFGLNAFAYELARLDEGAYDSLVTKLTNATITKWVEDSKKKPIPKKSFVDIDVDEVDGKGREIEFNYVGLVEFTDKVDGYEVDGTSNSGEDKDKIPFVATLFKINPKVLPQAWSKISADVSDVIRHEIEHLTQAGDNTRSGKYMQDDIDIRDLINKAKVLPQKNYYMLEKEVDAMLQGLYLKAKKTKKPFKDVLKNYLDMAPGIETKEDRKTILNLWRSRRKALSLPIFEDEKMPKSSADLFTIYLDMDGVIVDFDKQFEEQFGMPPREFENNFGTDKFWDKIDSKGVGFWRGMDWMPGGQQLYNRVSQYNHFLLSSPSRSEKSKIGKRLWRRDNTPDTKLILSRSYNKKNYADKSNILIDDRADNIQQWKDAGGIGILYQSAEQVMKELDKLGL